MSMKTISFVIPVFRNEGSLRLTYQKIHALFSSELAGYEYDFVFVNDGSDDGSLDELLGLHREDRKVRVLSLSRNFGQMAAMLAGLENAHGDAVINMSADLQEPVEMIPQMVQEWSEGNEIVICYRTARHDSLINGLTSKVFYKLAKLTHPQMPEGGFDFTLMDKQVVQEFNRIRERNRYFQGDIFWLGFTVKFLPYKRLERTIGKSQYNFSKRLKNAIDGLLNQSYLPIRFMSLTGILTAFIGFLYAVSVVYARVMHQTPFTGWAPIMVLILVIGGLNMLMLGIVGEYVWRTYDEAKKRPNYIIHKRYE